MPNIIDKIEVVGATQFTGLSDTPNKYIGEANKLVKVSPNEQNLVFEDRERPESLVGAWRLGAIASSPTAGLFTVDNADPLLVANIMYHRLDEMGADHDAQLAFVKVGDDLRIISVIGAAVYLYDVTAIAKQPNIYHYTVTVASADLPPFVPTHDYTLYTAQQLETGTFAGLTDTPKNYAGGADMVVFVKHDESGLEFRTAPSGGTGAVSSFNARTGAVVPVSGDYDIPKIIGLQPALDAKAPIASPTFTGAARAETAGAGTDTTQIATTAFVKRDFVDIGGDTMTGNLTINGGATNMFRLNAGVGKTIAMGTDGNMLPEFSITGSPANDYVFNLFTDPAGGAPNAWSLKFKIANGNLGLTDQAGSAITPLADEDLANKKYVDDHAGGVTEQPAIPDLPTLTSTPTNAEFDDIINKINTTLATLRTAGIIAT